MYLLMLLATFMSAIYGYNLSIRPDYDRDIPHKKALAVHFKFTHQHSAAKKIIINAKGGLYAPNILELFPGDLIYTDSEAAEEDKQALILRQPVAEDNEHSILVRKALNSTGDEEGSNIMRLGRTLFPSDVMASQVVCSTKEIDENDVEQACEPERDEEGNILKSCCGVATSYIVSYRILDARWLNRLTNQVNSDFMWSVSKREYAENIGVVTWDDKLNAWLFTGKIGLYAMYRKDKEEFEKTHGGEEVYPLSKKHRTQWVMPNRVFKQDFFKYWNSKTRRMEDDLCKNGCLVKIEEI